MRKTFHTSLLLIICFAPEVLVLNGCSRSHTTRDAVATVSPEASPTPTPADPVILAGPVNEEGVELILTGVRQAEMLSSGSAYSPSMTGGFPSDNRTRYTPMEGMTFLVVDAQFRNLDPSLKSIKVSSEKASLIEESGKVLTANGSGTSRATSLEKTPDSRDYCVGCKTSLEAQNVSQGNIEMPISFVFTIKKQAINQPFKFRYAKMPELAFKLGNVKTQK